MPIELKMPALSPTMEEGTLAKWLVKEGDTVSSGDLLAEIETDKATMEFEAIDEGTVAKLLVPAGTEGVKVGTVIALIAGDDEDAAASAPATTAGAASAPPARTAEPPVEEKGYGADPQAEETSTETAPPPAADTVPSGEGRVKASPLARRLAAEKGVDVGALKGSGPKGRVVKLDVLSAEPGSGPAADATRAVQAEPKPAPGKAAPPAPAAGIGAASGPVLDGAPPHDVVKLSSMRKIIARRLTESKQQVPHIYLTIDIRLDALLKLRTELNAALETRGVKLSVNDMLIKALALSLIEVPACNVSFAGDTLLKYSRADISVAVSIPGGLITPIIAGADGKSMSAIATEMKVLAQRAKDGKLQPHEFQGGTASLSNMGMFGIKQFDAVINPPQAMIMAIGAGEQRPYIVDGKLDVATVMSATGSFDHRAIDGADGAQLMAAFKRLIEQPLGMLA